jgi:sulfatase modifying factor 1
MNAPALDLSRLPPVFPEPWASGWGQDRFGLWQSFTVDGVTQVLRWIPLGDFPMGSPETEVERFEEGVWGETQHPVILTQGFWLADTACTQALWRAVLDEMPSRFQGDERPVEQVSWEDVVERFLPALNRLLPGLEGVLPSEAQWEYACRAGNKTPTPFWFGESLSTDQANFDGNHPYADGPKDSHRRETVEVKALPANGWGLYQMHGNVWEWCVDWLGEYPRDLVVDPEGPPEGRERVLRGGGWFDFGGFCRSAKRGGNDPGNRTDNIGFRLARGPSPRQAGSAGVAGVADGGGAPSAAPGSRTRGMLGKGGYGSGGYGSGGYSA